MDQSVMTILKKILMTSGLLLFTNAELRDPTPQAALHRSGSALFQVITMAYGCGEQTKMQQQ